MYAARLASPADAPTVHALTQAAFAAYATLTPPSGALKETVESVRDDLAADGGLLASDAGEPVGCLRFARRDGLVLVRRVAVLPARQGQGVGRALVSEAERIVVAAGQRELRLGVRLALPGNLAFYTGLGYAVVARHDHPDGTPYWVEMAKPLGYPRSQEVAS